MQRKRGAPRASREQHAAQCGKMCAVLFFLLDERGREGAGAGSLSIPIRQQSTHIKQLDKKPSAWCPQLSSRTPQFVVCYMHMEDESLEQFTEEEEEVTLSSLCGFSEKQQAADHAVDTYKYTLYGGAMAGGKSYFIRWKLIKLLIHWFNVYDIRDIEVGLFCEDYPTLKDRQLSKIASEIPEWIGKLHDDHKAHGKCFILAQEYGGGIIKFRNLDDPSKYRSAEFAAIAVDELTMNVKETFLDLKHRLRWPGIEDVRFFAGTNPGGPGHCVPYGDVLTREGWMPIEDVRVGDEVLTLNDQGEDVFVKVDQTIAEQYAGELYESDNWSARFTCTPDHKIPIVTETKNKKGRIFHKPKLRKVKDMVGVSRTPKIGTYVDGVKIETFTPPTVKTRKTKLDQPVTISGDEYVELMGWFLSEGYTIDRDKMFGIAQLKAKNRAKIRDLLSRCGFDFRENSKSFTVYSPGWWSYFSQFGKCRDKFVPTEIKNSSRAQMKIFMDAMMLGDGCDASYYTTSRQLADDVQEIWHKMGYRTYLSSRQRENRVGLSYCVGHRANKLGWIGKDKIRKTHFNGLVYCLGIENLHRFYLRQNGSVYLSGNSWVKKIWMDRDFEPEEMDEAHEYFYVAALAKDNPHIAQSYLKQLDTLPADMARAFRDGDWDIFKGQFFGEWRRTVHTCKPFKPPVEWKRFICGDYGYSAPAAVYWCAVSPDDVVYVYRELYMTGLTYEALTKEIIARTPDDEWDSIGYWVFDPAIWAKSGASATALSGADIMEQTFSRMMKDSGKRRFLRLLKGDNQRVIGWGMLRERFKPRLCSDSEVRAGIQVTEDCTNLIREIPSLVYDKNNVEDCDSSGSDHGADAIRYGLMSNPQRSRTAEEEEERAFRKKIKANRRKSSLAFTSGRRL